MISTEFTKETATELIELGKEFHKESRHGKFKFDEQRVWDLAANIKTHPEKYHINYYRNQDGKIVGMFIGIIVPEFFSGRLLANDMGMYVAPEYRGTRVFIKMLKTFETWAKESGAEKIILYHSAGINTDKAISLFSKLGYEHYGFIFDKEF